jgi:response regulator RpfG family c-di-GMP phosphodiesterase
MTYAAGRRFCGVKENGLFSLAAARAQPGPISLGEVILLAERLESTDPEPVIGADLIRHAGLSWIAGWVFAHHERADGLGYPRGLGAADIPLESSVLAVADAYHAMITDRPYRAAMDPASALAEIERAAGSQFDPLVVDAFIPSMERVLVDTSPL